VPPTGGQPRGVANGRRDAVELKESDTTVLQAPGLGVRCTQIKLTPNTMPNLVAPRRLPPAANPNFGSALLLLSGTDLGVDVAADGLTPGRVNLQGKGAKVMKGGDITGEGGWCG
jgi:hypothetical protein